MKKNISININGIIFHIEEDGYNMLREYLDSIKDYFSSLDRDGEIVADIESRVAEILASKLSEGQQVITAEDIVSLTKKMGSIDDFKEAAQEIPIDEKGGHRTREERTVTSSKRLYRDRRDKIIGGVCAGIGYYLGIDPVWIRLLFVILAIGSVGSLTLVYIILWIVMPSSESLEVQPSAKKMFRNPKDKMVGGVASGMAAFLGVDVVLIRVLFLILAFVGGTGLLMYIVLWIILPEAKSLTEEMQMQGKPVTLSNIESAIKKKTADEPGKESRLTKIILLPVRLAALILNKVAKIASVLILFLVALIRILVGVVIVFIGFISLVIVLAAIGIGWEITELSSLWGWGIDENLSIPMEAFSNAFPLWVLIPALAMVGVILLFILLSGISILSKKNVFKPMVSWSLLIVFVVSMTVLAIKIPNIVFPFTKKGTYEEESRYVLSQETPIFKLNDTGLEDYSVTSLQIIGHTDSVMRVVKTFTAQGKTRKKARSNTRMVEYNVEQADNTFWFDSNITFKKDAVFRAQRLQVDLYMPFGQPFKVDDDLWEIIENYRPYSVRRNCESDVWEVTPSGVVCYPSKEQDIPRGDREEDER